MNVVRFTHFSIRILNGANSLYANNRQQLAVTVEYIKTVNGVNTPLTTRELESLQLVARDGEAMPDNWSSDQQHRGFDEGLWQSRSMADSSDGFVEGLEQQVGPAAENSSVQFVTLFLRARLNAESREFRATVVIDELRRFYSDRDAGEPAVGNLFNSWIRAVSIAPYTLHAADLSHFIEVGHRGAGSGSSTAETIVHYWRLPSGLRVMQEIGSGGGRFQPPGLSLIWDSGRRLMFRITHTVSNLSVGQIRRYPHLNNQNVRLNNRPDLIRACMDYIRSHPVGDWGRATSMVMIVDNFGCEHRFLLAQVDNNTISLTVG
ncbi:hypothetical protein [Pseudomonas sp. EMN2]|uniref:hypothetical protein n=1 Tax=Pseudomonas sp. EMN2 TaxID=2615212 RepID=UPI00129B9CE4|nr:hypothetical protein [Pseudomonas sp. EMN2]